MFLIISKIYLFLLIHFFQFVLDAAELGGNISQGQPGDFGNLFVAFLFQIEQDDGFFQLSQPVYHPVELP